MGSVKGDQLLLLCINYIAITLILIDNITITMTNITVALLVLMNFN